MYYRYEARCTKGNDEDKKWQGIFQCFGPDERRKWYCLHVPKWYEQNPDIKSQAWFTQHGYEKWHEKMEKTIEDFLLWRSNGWEIRLLQTENLNNIVSKGKTQCIIRIE